MPFKITAIGDQGGDTFHGADDIDKFAKVFGDVDISSTDPVFVATSFTFRDGKLRLSNTSKTHSLIIRFPDGGYSGDITLNVPTIASSTDTLVTTSTNAGGGGSGEANTASNQGVGGVGLFISKVAVDLQFKNINAGSNKITVTNDAANKEVDIDVAEANLTLANLAGTLPYSKLVLTNSVVNADVASAAAIAYSKLNLTGAIVNADVSTSAAIAWSKIAVPANTATTDTAQTLTNKNLTDATNTFRAWANADIATSAAIAYSKLNLGTSIVNSDIATAAAIAYSKLNLTGAIVNADISTSAAIAYSKLSLGTSIVNADISATAAIAKTKLASLAIVDADISTTLSWSKISKTGSVLADIGNVSFTSLATGDFLKWNGTNWINTAVSAGISTSATNTWSAVQTFNDGDLALRNPANTFSSIVKGGAQVSTDKTFTFPVAASDTIVLVAATQTITGKTMDYNSNTFQNFPGGVSTSAINTWSAVQTFADGDLALRNPANTFSAIVKAGAQITSDKTFTFPVAASDTILLEAATQTITNKTFAAGSNTITGIVDANIGTHTTTKITTSSKSLLNSAIVYNDQTNTWGAFDQVFKSSNFKIANPANTFNNIFVSAAIAADRTITLPLLTGNDTMVTAAFAQTLTNKTVDAASNTISNIVDANIGTHTTTKITTSSKSLLNSAIVYNDQTNTFGAFNQIFPSSRLLIQNPAGTFNYTIVGAAIAAARNLSLPLLTGDDTVVTAAFAQALTNKTIAGGSNTITGILDTSLSNNVNLLNAVQTFSAVKTFGDGNLALRNPANTFSAIVKAGAQITADKTFTFPVAASDNIVLETATETLTNKTFTAPAINGTVTTTGLTLPTLTMGGDLALNNNNVTGAAIYYSRATDATNLLKVISTGNTTPQQDLYFGADHTKQVGSTGDTLYLGYNSDWQAIRFFSHWTGTNIEYLTIDTGVGGFIKLRGTTQLGQNTRIQFNDFGLSAQREFLFPDVAGTLLTDVATQTMTNKTVNASTNILQQVAQDPIVKRTGFAVPKANTLFLDGVLADHTFGTTGTIANTYDTTEGVITTLPSTATTTIAVGLVSATTGVGMCRRLFAGRARIRWKIDSTTTARLYFGFTSATALPISDTPLATTDHGIIVGWSTSDTTYQIYHNDGATSVTKDAVTGAIAKDAAFHTIEINWTAAGNINVIFDGTSQTISADLPATTANLFFFAEGQTSAGTARTLSIKGAWLEFDK